jgi:adenosylhomocysteine nucleosidase
VARRAGLRTALIGLGASLPIPEGPLLGFGVAGALVSGLGPGTVVTASRVVDGEGQVLWQGEPPAVPGGRLVVFADVGRIVDEPEDREALAVRTGAEVVDMESAALARTGRLVGVVRAVVDTPDERLGRLAFAVKPDGSTDWPAVARAFAAEPVSSVRVALRARRAFKALAGAASALAPRSEAGTSRPTSIP